MKKKKILFIIPYPIEGASSRYRVHQYLPALREAGFGYTVSPFISNKFYKIIYLKGRLLKKAYFTLQGLLRRLYDILRLPFYDLIFIHIEAAPFSLPILEYCAKLCNRPIIYDFDDAHFLKRKSSWFRILFRSHKKTPRIIKLSKRVIVCNDYLKEYSSKFIDVDRISVVPTPIDSSRFKRIDKTQHLPIIGWIGSHSTSYYLETILNIFPEIYRKHEFVLKIVGAPKKIRLPGIPVIQKPWRLKDELSDFQGLDIGIYPLSSSEWVKGKAAFKAIQYMAVQVPCVASNFGMTREVIQSGVSGYLVNTRDEWIEKIELLLSSKELRERIAKQGRTTIVERFSLHTQAKNFIGVLKDALSST